MSPTARTLAWLREQGYAAEVVERHNHFSGKKHDLFGCLDIVAIQGPLTIGIQATSGANVAARVAKIKLLAGARSWLDGGRRELWVVGWRKYKSAVDKKYWRPYVLVMAIQGGAVVPLVPA